MGTSEYLKSWITTFGTDDFPSQKELMTSQVYRVLRGGYRPVATQTDETKQKWAECEKLIVEKYPPKGNDDAYSNFSKTLPYYFKSPFYDDCRFPRQRPVTKRMYDWVMAIKNEADSDAEKWEPCFGDEVVSADRWWMSCFDPSETYKRNPKISVAL